MFEDILGYPIISQCTGISEYLSIFIEPATFSGTLSGTLPLLALNPELIVLNPRLKLYLHVQYVPGYTLVYAGPGISQCIR
jgi:hypothetical protein